MMQRLYLVFALAFLLGGCAHKELKAPCDPLSFAGGDTDCGALQPVNRIGVFNG